MGLNEFHQMIIRLDDLEATEEVTASLKEKLPNLEVMHWKELQPDLAMMTDMVTEILCQSSWWLSLPPWPSGS